MSGDITVSNNSSKALLVLEILYFMVRKNVIIFTAPLANRSRKLAVFLSIFSKNIILANKDGNMYQINSNINIQ